MEPFNLQQWINDNRGILKPPVGNKNLYVEAGDFIVMVVGGPNARKDYHFNESEEHIDLQIMNAQGKQIAIASVTSVPGTNTWYLKEDLASGVYYIVLSGEGGINIMVKHVVR